MTRSWRSPSPRPSPAGRGRIVRRVGRKCESEISRRLWAGFVEANSVGQLFPSPSGRGIKGEGERADFADGPVSGAGDLVKSWQSKRPRSEGKAP